MIMTETQLIKMVDEFKKYNITIRHNGLSIVSINDHPATLNAAEYMPDQMVRVICQFMQTQIIAEMWRA